MFELWQEINGIPFFLIKKHESFNLIYNLFEKNSNKMKCVIVKNESKKRNTRVFIYESPDGGKTVYKRPFGDYKNKILVKKEEIN